MNQQPILSNVAAITTEYCIDANPFTCEVFLMRLYYTWKLNCSGENQPELQSSKAEDARQPSTDLNP